MTEYTKDQIQTVVQQENKLEEIIVQPIVIIKTTILKFSIHKEWENIVIILLLYFFLLQY